MKPLLLLIVCLFISTSSYAEDTIDSILKKGVLKVGLEAGYMPFEMRDKRGNIIGLDVDLAKDMAKSMGVKLEIVNVEWDGIIPGLLTKKFDIIMAGMTITQKRNLKVNFSDPYIVIGQTILLNKKLKGKIKSYKDLNNKKYKLVSKLGTTGENTIKKMIPKANYKSYQTSQDAAMEVINGRADALVYDLPQISMLYKTQAKGKAIFLDRPFTYEPLAFAIRKSDPNFLNWINNWLRQIKNDGTYEKFHKKWFKDTRWHSRVK